MRRELAVVAGGLGNKEPTEGEPTHASPRASTDDPTNVFERPTSMYPLAHVDTDDSDALEPSVVCDPEALIRRVDEVPAINAGARVIKFRAKGTQPPPSRPTPRPFRPRD